MILGYMSFLLLVALKDTNGYNPKRHAQVSSKTSDSVIPARYKVTSTTNYEGPPTTSLFPADYFPEVEYPESIVDSSKPFYLSSSPFPNDVKSTFKSLAKNNKAKPTTDYSWIHDQKEKVKETEPQKIGANDNTGTKETEINSNDKNTNETIDKEHKDVIVLNYVDKTGHYESRYIDNDMDELLANLTSADLSSESETDDIVVVLINDLDELMKNLTATGSTQQEDNNTVHTIESECDYECKLISSDMTPNNNHTITEFNGNPFLKEECEQTQGPLFEESDTSDAVSNLTSLLNKFITNTSSVDDMQSDFCSIGPIANETNTTCTEN